MLSVSAARQMIRERIITTPGVSLPLQEAAGLVLAADVYAPADVPFFHQSAMDGYAFSFQNWQQQPLDITTRIPAGSYAANPLLPGEAARIYTGAPLPEGADTVVMQERTEQMRGRLYITDALLQEGSNVRYRGSEIGNGNLALAAGSYLSPAGIGFLANLGISRVTVYSRVNITLIITGSELQQPGHPLLPGQVYESNSFMLTAALQWLPVIQLSTQYVKDDITATIQAIKTAKQHSDMILVTGGVSAGDYDFVAEAMLASGIKKVFHKIKQKPGKPLLVGCSGRQLLFGLPGNPASVLTCFYEYVLPAIEMMSGQTQSGIQTVQRRLTAPVHKKAGLTHFLKASCDAAEVTPTGAQQSYRLSSFASANCLLVLEEEVTFCDKGDWVTVHLLPTAFHF